MEDLHLISTAADLGALLRQKRKSQKLTLADVSLHSGLSVRFISEVERGKTTAEIGKVMELLAIVGVDLFARAR